VTSNYHCAQTTYFARRVFYREIVRNPANYIIPRWYRPGNLFEHRLTSDQDALDGGVCREYYKCANQLRSLPLRVLSARVGHPTLGDFRHVPVFVSQTPGAADALSSNPMGFAPILKPALPAVVNIASSRVVKMPLEPFFNDPFFRRFFGSPRHLPPPEQR
jgi:hypothetical protein